MPTVTDAQYFPKRGDIVWLDFATQAGYEETKRRPALVLSANSYNDKRGLAIFCPITDKVNGYPWEVELPKGFQITGAILSDQVKSLDWKVRNLQFICQIPEIIMGEIVDKLFTLFD